MLGNILQYFWTGVKDSLLPPQCVACGEAVASAPGLCGKCWAELRFRNTDDVAPEGIWRKVQAAVLFDEKSRNLVHGLKYHDQLELADLMARLMLRAAPDMVAEADLLVPVPLHSRRLWSRRFNQAALLSQKIAAHSHHAWNANILLREKATKAQVGLSALARRGNMAGAFHLAESQQGLLKGKHILLIDDVMTTGATAGEAVHCLLRGGAKQVDVLVFALVVEPYKSHIRHHGKN